MQKMKKRIKVISFLLTVILVMTMCSCNSFESKELGEKPTEAPTKDPATVDFKEKTVFAEELYAMSKIQGRTKVLDFNDGSCETCKGIALDYTASAVEFNLCCEGKVSVSLYVKTYVGQAHNQSANLFVTVLVDGVKQGTRKVNCLEKGYNELVLAENLAKGTHTFEVIRQSEAEYGEIYLTNVKFCGEPDAKPVESHLYIEIIGDSITTGYGNLYPNNTDGAVDQFGNPRSAVYEDGTQAYAYLAAKALDADYSIVAQQGIGASVGWQPHTMLETYEKTCYQLGRNDNWSFDRQPDLVVINLGSNDFTCPDGVLKGGEELRDGFVEFIKLVRKKNPDAKILWAHGGVDPQAAPWVQEAVKKAGGEAKGIYCFTDFVCNIEGGIGHPVVSAHEQNAALLVSKIKEIMGES